MLNPNALERCAEVILESGADIVAYCHSRSEDFVPVASKDGLLPGVYEGERYELVKRHVCQGRFNSLWGKAIRLCLVDTDAVYGAYEGLMHGEDLFQFLPIVERATSLVQLDDILYFYRSSEESSTSRYRSNQLNDIVTVNRRLIEYANKWGGVCVEAAVIGETKQYLNLLKMSELDSSCREKEQNFFAIASTMEAEGTFLRLEGVKLRLDDRCLVVALKQRRYRLARSLVAGVEVMKRWI